MFSKAMLCNGNTRHCNAFCKEAFAKHRNAFEKYCSGYATHCNINEMHCNGNKKHCNAYQSTVMKTESIAMKMQSIAMKYTNHCNENAMLLKNGFFDMAVSAFLTNIARALVKKTLEPGIKLQKADFFRNDTWTSPQTNPEESPKYPPCAFF